MRRNGMLKKDKITFVAEVQKAFGGYKSFAIMPLESVPDRLLQKVRNEMKKDTRIVIARKTLMKKILEGSGSPKVLSEYVEDNVALIASNKEPFELNRIISANKIRLSAKPGQIAPSDIFIEAGETAIPPGQAVTELKSAGIDVQIQKGKVVIGKSKVLVPKGMKIQLPVAKALKTLGIMPFETGTKIRTAFNGGLLYSEEVLGITPSVVSEEIASCFRNAYAVSIETGYVTEYNVKELVKRAYLGALGVGIASKAYEPEIMEKLLADAVAQALKLDPGKA
jgi:large subunit ribosomal protein L10